MFKGLLVTCKEYVGVSAGHGTSLLGQSLSHTPGSPEIIPCSNSCFSALRTSDIHLLAQSHKEVVWLHVPVDEVLPMDELNPAYQLIRQQEDRFEAELPVAEVEEVLQAGPQQLHHHHVELPLAPVVLHKGDAHSSLHHLLKYLNHLAKSSFSERALKQAKTKNNHKRKQRDSNESPSILGFLF